MAEHCPGWDVGDLVNHLTEVQWSWGTIFEEGLTEPPSEDCRPPRAAQDQLVATFSSGADRLVRVLRAADGHQPAWTWAPGQKDVNLFHRLTPAAGPALTSLPR